MTSSDQDKAGIEVKKVESLQRSSMGGAKNVADVAHSGERPFRPGLFWPLREELPLRMNGGNIDPFVPNAET